MNRQELLKALETVRPGLASREMLEQTTSFAFIDGRVVTYNDEISISHPITGLEIEGAVKAEQLHNFLTKISTDEISVEIKGAELQLKAGKAKAGLTLQQEVILPLDEIGDVGKWKNVPKGLIDALRFAMFTCTRDTSAPVLTCVHVQKQGRVESSDNIRLTRVTVPKVPVSTFLIPASSVRELVKYDIVKMAEGEGWVHFATKDDTVFSCRVFEDNFPDAGQLLKVDGKELEMPEGLGEVLDRAAVFAKRENKLDEEVEIIFTKGKVTVYGRSDAGWFEEALKAPYKQKEETRFSINPAFLKEVITHLQTCTLGKNVMKFEGENWEHAICLGAGA